MVYRTSFRGILITLPMVYGTPTHGKSNPLSMVYQALYPLYCEAPTNDTPSPLPMVVLPPTNGIPNIIPMVVRTPYE